MKKTGLGSLAAIAIVSAGCSAQSIQSGSSSHCDKAGTTPSSDTSAKGNGGPKTNLLLAGEKGTAGSPLGGLLVFDALDAASYAELGYAKAQFKPDQKCSANFEFFKKGSAYVARLLTTEQCYTAFYRASRKQRLLVNHPGTSEFVELKATDERFEKASRFLSSLDGFTPKFRENELIQFLGRSIGTVFSFYTGDVKGMTPEEADAFDKTFCYGAKTATPKECLWPNGMHFDEVTISADGLSIPVIDSLVEKTKEAREAARRSLFTKVPPSILGETLLFSDRMVAVSKGTDTMEAVNNMHRFLACDVTNSRTKCSGMDRSALDKAAVGIADIYAPEWKARVQAAAAATTDRKDKVKALYDDSDVEFVEEVVRPFFVPALESYMELRKLFAANASLLAIAANYGDPAGKAEGLAFKTLSPFASPTGSELTGISLSVDANGNVLLSHPGKEKNRNLTLDGHRGSVLTFGGLPILAFDPFSIDQSDATSVMPIPKTSAKSSAADSKGPGSDSSASERSKTTVGEGKSGKGC